MKHVITEKRWSDPFLSRRASFTCTCGETASGAVSEVLDARGRHERTAAAQELIEKETQK